MNAAPKRFPTPPAAGPCRRAYAPGEFAAALNDRLPGANFSRRFVQKLCLLWRTSRGRRGVRSLSTFPGRYFIPESELERLLMQ